MTQITCSNTINESIQETIDLKKEDNLCKQLKKNTFNFKFTMILIFI